MPGLLRHLLANGTTAEWLKESVMTGMIAVVVAVALVETSRIRSVIVNGKGSEKENGLGKE